MNKNDTTIKILREEYDNISSIKNILGLLKLRYKLLTLLLVILIFISAFFFIYSENNILSIVSYLIFSTVILISIKLLNMAIRNNNKSLFNDSNLTEQESYIRQLQSKEGLDISNDVFKAHNVMKINNCYNASTKLLFLISSAINTFLIPICLTVILRYENISDTKLIFYTSFFCILIPIIIFSTNGILYNRQSCKDNKIIYYLDLYKANKE